MADYHLYMHRNSYAMSTHLLLEELGIDYAVTWFNVHKPEEFPADFLQLNPNARVPLLITPDGPIYESAATMMYLSEQHDGQFMPAAERLAQAIRQAGGAQVRITRTAPSASWAVPCLVAQGMGLYMMHNTLQVNATQMAPDARGAAVALFAAMRERLTLRVEGALADPQVRVFAAGEEVAFNDDWGVPAGAGADSAPA